MFLCDLVSLWFKKSDLVWRLKSRTLAVWIVGGGFAPVRRRDDVEAQPGFQLGKWNPRIRCSALGFVSEFANIDGVDGVNFPERETLEIFCIIARRVIAGFSFGSAGHVTAIKEQLARDLYLVGFEELGVVG